MSHRSCPVLSRMLTCSLLFVSASFFASPAAGTTYGYLVGYALQEGSSVCSLSPFPVIQAPLYAPYNRNSQQWWYNLVEEVAFSNVPFIGLNFRGDSPCGKFPPAGNEPTAYATNLVNAINQRGYTDFLKVALFDDTGSYQPHLSQCTGSSASFDFSSQALWEDYIWSTRWKPFFQRVPDTNRMKINGRPLVILWSVADGLGFVNQQGNLSSLISYLRNKCLNTFGFDPWIVVHHSWLREDSTVGSLVNGVHEWFNPNPAAPLTSWSKRTHTGPGGITFTTGVVVPGFWVPRSGQPALFLDRHGGTTLRNGLSQTAGSDLVILEGLTDVEEAAAYFRGDPSTCRPPCGSPTPPAGQCWSHPNQYINIVREFALPFVRYVVFEAEASDTYQSFNTTASALYRRTGTLNIAYTDGTHSNWAVRLRSDEWLQFNNFQLGGSSNYRLSVRYSSASGASARLLVGGVVKATFSLPPTGSLGSYAQAQNLSTFTVNSGNQNVRFELTSGVARIDWWLLDGLS